MILKFINGKNSDPSQLQNIIEYVRDSEKTKSELTGGYCCDTQYPFEDMKVHKKLHNKASGKQYEHFIISFDPEDNIDDAKALDVISEIVRINGNHQSFYALHTNTPHLHAHVVMNSVGSDGKKFRQWKPQLHEFKDRINAICYRNGIEPVKQTSGSKPVDDLDLLEFSNEELILGGFTMNSNEFYTPMEYEDYLPTEDDRDYEDYDYDGDGDYDNYKNNGNFWLNNVNTPTPKRKGLYLGNTYNINTTSESEAKDFIKSCQSTTNITPQAVKEIMNYFGNDIDYHIGHKFNITLSGNSISKSTPERPNMDAIDVDDYDFFSFDDEN